MLDSGESSQKKTPSGCSELGPHTRSTSPQASLKDPNCWLPEIWKPWPLLPFPPASKQLELTSPAPDSGLRVCDPGQAVQIVEQCSRADDGVREGRGPCSACSLQPG